MSNQECTARFEITNINNNNPVFYPFNIKTSKCSGNCNNINYPNAKICAPDVIKDLKICPPGVRAGLSAVGFSRAYHWATDALKSQLFS